MMYRVSMLVWRIVHWAASVDCEPGYLTNVIQAIGKLAERKVCMKDVVLNVDANVNTQSDNV